MSIRGTTVHQRRPLARPPRRVPTPPASPSSATEEKTQEVPTDVAFDHGKEKERKSDDRDERKQGEEDDGTEEDEEKEEQEEEAKDNGMPRGDGEDARETDDAEEHFTEKGKEETGGGEQNLPAAVRSPATWQQRLQKHLQPPQNPLLFLLWFAMIVLLHFCVVGSIVKLFLPMMIAKVPSHAGRVGFGVDMRDASSRRGVDAQSLYENEQRLQKLLEQQVMQEQARRKKVDTDGAAENETLAAAATAAAINAPDTSPVGTQFETLEDYDEL